MVQCLVRIKTLSVAHGGVCRRVRFVFVELN